MGLCKTVILKPCPFCGNPGKLRECESNERPVWAGTYGEWWMIECSSEYCGVHPKVSAGEKETVITSWNCRKRANKLTYKKEEQKTRYEEMEYEW